jgi:hypothetical protein
VFDWVFLGGLAAGAAFLASRGVVRKRGQEAAADASGLVPVADLSHIPAALQKTALWTLGDGGFERRVVHGVMPRDAEDVDITAFDLETLRERRGEWAWLPVEPPFRIAGVVSVVVCEVDRAFPQLLLKRAGRGDQLIDDAATERLVSVTKVTRDAIGMSRSYAAEMPPNLSMKPLDVVLPEHWRAYGADPVALRALLDAGLARTLAKAGRRDLVIELVDGLVVMYPAARDVVGADAFADLTSMALQIVDGVLASSPRVSPRGLEVLRPA